MDNKAINKTKQADKERSDDRKKDRGDNLKKQDGIKNKLNDGVNPKVARKPPLPDQGDVLVINKLIKIPKPQYNLNKFDKVSNDKVKKQNEIKPRLTGDVSSKVNTGAEKISLNKSSEINNAPVDKNKVGDRNLGDKVNSRPKTLNNPNQGKDTNKNAMKSDLKTDVMKNQQPTKPAASREIIFHSTNPECTDAEPDVAKKEKNTTAYRKPMIKTVKSKNDDKVYKAVTFRDQKLTKPTILEINIPNTQVKKAKTKLVDKNLEAKPASVQGTSTLDIKNKSQHNRRNRLTERTKRKKLNRCISSPDKFKKVDSPPTEVAKWAPSCLNTHTKPYYEAWVNTTLAAISKISKKDKLLLEKQNIIKSFQKSLQLRTESPDLIHENYTDECYTGKIKIKQKNMSKRTRQPLILPLIDVDK